LLIYILIGLNPFSFRKRKGVSSPEPFFFLEKRKSASAKKEKTREGCLQKGK